MPFQEFPGILQWFIDSPEHRVELTSHAVWTADGCLIFDPIPCPSGMALPEKGPTRIVLTNENHERAAAAWRQASGVAGGEIWASPEAGLELRDVRRWSAIHDDWPGWIRVPLPGGPAGETAFHNPARSLVVFGDAVVNLTGRGLEILPDKYCQDAEMLRTSLRRLPAFDRALFAHGAPVWEDAGARIAALL